MTSARKRKSKPITLEPSPVLTTLDLELHENFKNFVTHNPILCGGGAYAPPFSEIGILWTGVLIKENVRDWS